METIGKCFTDVLKLMNKQLNESMENPVVRKPIVNLEYKITNKFSLKIIWR